MTEPLPRDDVRVRLVAHTLKHRWLRIVVLAIVMGAAVGAYAFTRSVSYRSSAIVLLRPLQGNALSSSTAGADGSNTVAMETEASLITSQPVTRRVNQVLDTEMQPNTSAVTVSVPVNSQIINIKCELPDASTARQCAQQYATNYLEFRSDLAASAQRSELEKLRAQLDDAQADLRVASKQAASANPPSDAKTRVKLYSANVSSLLGKIAQIRSTTTDPGSVILSATPASASGRIVAIALTAGAVVLGALFGFVLGLWRERRQDLVRTPAETLVAGLPILGIIPHASDTAASRPPGHDEAVRQTRVTVLATAGDRRVLGLAGVGDGDGQRTVATDLARTLASAGYRVALVDAAITDNQPAPLLGVASESGLMEMLAEPGGRLPVTDADGVHVLPAGTITAAARERVAGQELQQVLRRLGVDHDYVFVVCARATSSDGLSVALAMDGMILVGTDGQTTHVEVAAAAQTIHRLDVDVVGVVLQRAVSRKRAKAATTEPRVVVRPARKVSDERTSSPSDNDAQSATKNETDDQQVDGGSPVRSGASQHGKNSGDASDRKP